MSEHAYPTDLAQFVSRRWNQAKRSVHEWDTTLIECGSNPELLEPLLSVCYQASLLREELRPITLRVIFCRPECFSHSENPPSGFHVLQFDTPRKFDPHELRVLSQSAGFYRSLIGVGLSARGELEIWGIVHSGPRWLRALHGGRKDSANLPESIVIRVNGPGYIEVCKGSVLVAQLHEGLISDASMNVFESQWLSDLFAGVRGDLMTLHERAREQRGQEWSAIDPNLARTLAQQMAKRLIAAIQASHHGGMLIIVPPERGPELLEENPILNVKYKFMATEARARYWTLILAIMEIMAKMSVGEAGKVRGWHEYEMAVNDSLLSLDEALFEMSYLIAGLTAVDGAVVLSKRFEILGFGSEITYSASDVRQVARALDIEGNQFIMERIDGFGTRHRSAYRFASYMPGSITIVISQDGGVQFVSARDSVVTYWNHGTSMQTTPS